MTFWNTFWATMSGALAGGAFGAFVAWLFALDLRRRETRARDDEREVQQSALMRREWADLADLFREHAITIRALPPGLPFGLLRSIQLLPVKASRRELNRRLVRAGALATGEDVVLVNALGVAANAHFVEGPVQTAALDLAATRLVSLAVTAPAEIAAARAAAIRDLDHAVEAMR